VLEVGQIIASLDIDIIDLVEYIKYYKDTYNFILEIIKDCI
jgi:hypothetical protein